MMLLLLLLLVRQFSIYIVMAYGPVRFDVYYDYS